MNIGVLGSGDVAKALGAGFLKHGHSVMMGTRAPSKLEAWSADLGGVEGARAIEPLCILWCIPGFVRGEWTHAFKVLHG